MSSFWDSYGRSTPTPGARQREEDDGSFWDSYGRRPTQPDKPEGIDSSVIDSLQRGGGQLLGNVGSTLRDLGAERVGGFMEGVGGGIVERNPGQINNTWDAITHPWQTTKEAVGEVVPQVGAQVGGVLAGRAIGGALGGAIAGPPGMLAGQWAGGALGGFAANQIQSYGGIRQEQREAGIEDKPRAFGASAASAALDTAFGVDRLVGKVLTPGSDILKREAGKSLTKHVGKQAAIGLGTEAITEIPQTAIERFGAHKPLTTPEAWDEYGVAGIKGGLGGGVIRGGLASVAGTRAPSPGTHPSEEPPEDQALQPEQPPMVQPVLRPAEQQQQMQQAQAEQMAADEQAAMDSARQYYRIKPAENEPEGTFDILGARVYGRESADTLVRELAELRSILPEHRQAIEQALVDAEAVAFRADQRPTARSVASKFDAEVKNLQLREAESVEQAAAILDSQVTAMVTAGKNEGDVRLGKIASVYEALTGKAPTALGGQPSQQAAAQQQPTAPTTPANDKGATPTPEASAPPLSSPAAQTPPASLPGAATSAAPAGTVRLYHGGHTPDGGPRWVTADPKYAEGYASKAGEGAGVYFVDVPADSPLLQKAFDDEGTSVKAPFVDFEAPAEIARNLRPLPQQGAANAGQPARPAGAPTPTAPVSVGSGSPDVGGSVGGTRPVSGVAPGAGVRGVAGQPVPSGAAVAAVPTATAQRPAPVTPAAAVEAAPGERVVQRKKRVVKPTPVAQGQAYVAPPSDDVNVDNRPAPTLADEDALDVAELTGQGSMAQVISGEQDGSRVDNEAKPLSDEAVDQILEKRLAGGQARVRDRDKQIIRAYLATMGKGTKGTKGKIAEALGRAFGMTPVSIRKIGNPRLLVEAAKELGIDPRQAREALGITERKSRTKDSVAAMEKEMDGLRKQYDSETDAEAKETLGYQIEDLAQDIAAADSRESREGERRRMGDAAQLAEEGIVAQEGETRGMGDDANRLWVDAASNPAVALADQINRLEAVTESMTEQGLNEAAAAVAKVREALQEAAQVEFAKVEKAKADKDKDKERAAAEAAKKPAKATKTVKAKAEPKEEPDDSPELTTEERAEKNWNAGVKKLGITELPLWAELPSDFQDEFAEFQAKDQTSKDVMTMVKKMNDAGVRFNDPADDMEFEDVENDADSEVEFSEGKQDDRPKYTAKDLTAEIKAFMRVKDLKNVVIVDDIKDIPDTTDMVIGGLFPKAFGWTRDGRAVLVASRIPAGNGRAVFMHEVGSHLGIEQLMDDGDLEQLALRITAWAQRDDGSRESKIAKKALERITDDTPDNQLEAEMVAYFVEEAVLDGVDPTGSNASGPLRSWLRELMANFKKALTRLGFMPEELTAQDIVDIAYGAAHMRVTDRLPSASKEGAPKFSLASRFGTNAAGKQAHQAAQTVVRHLTVKQHAGNLLNKAVFSEDLFARAETMGIPAAKQMGELYKSRAAKVGNMLRDVQKVEDLYKSIPTHERGTGPKSVNEFLKQVTMEQSWPFQPSWAPAAKVNPAMAARFNGMSKASQDWVRGVLEHGHKSLQDKKSVVTKAINDEFDGPIKDAVAAGNTAEAAKLQGKKNAQVKEFQKLLGSYEGQPYAPLRRFGDYVVVAKSAMYLAAENAPKATPAQADARSKALRKLEVDPAHYQVSFYDRMDQAEAARAKLEPQFKGGEAYARAKEEARGDMYGGMMSAFTKLRANIDRRMDDADSDSELKGLQRARNLVGELYLQSLAESSARKAELARKGIGGEIDMLQSFTRQGTADAHFVAAAEFNPKALSTISQMRKESRKGAADGQMAKSLVFNEIMARYRQSMEYSDDTNSAVQKLTRMTSVYMLGLSPMYYVQNLLQPIMLSLPFMTGRHNYTTAIRELAAAYPQITNVFKGSGANRQVDLTAVPADVKKAISELADRGRIDIGMETELGRVKLHGESRAEQVLQGALDTIDAAIKRVEVVNRMTTAMAAYRMELRATGNHQKAVDYADKVISQTHGDYSAVNAPRAFNTQWGKVALQFRKFQLIQLTLLAKAVAHSLPGNSPEEKAMARKVLTFTLAHTGIMAGMVGMPGFAAVSWILSTLDKVFGDDDEEPFDLEMWLRQQARDGGAPQWITDMLMRGTPTLAGADMSGRVGMGTALSIVPFTDIEMSKKGGQELFTALAAGASGGMAMRVWEGMGMVTGGDYYRGMERMLPKGVSDLTMKWHREAGEGVTRLNGDTLIPAEDISWARSMASAVGMPINAETNRRLATDAMYRNREHFTARSERVIKKYVAAKRDGEATAPVMAEWKKLQDARVAVGLPRQPLSTLLRSVKRAKERDKNTVGGVQYRKNERKMVERVLQDEDEDD